MASRPDDRLLEVVLDEGDGAGRPDPPEDAAAPRRRPAWRRPVLLAVAGVVVAAVVVVNVVQVRADAALRARLDGSPGYVHASLAEPLEEAWTRPGVAPLTADDGVLAMRGPGGALEGVELATGTSVWTRAMSGPEAWCDVVDPGGRLGRPHADTVVCHTPVEGGTAISLVTVATGHEVGGWTQPGRSDWSVRIDDLVLTQSVLGDVLHVVAWDTGTEQERWRWRSGPLDEPENVHVHHEHVADGRAHLVQYVGATASASSVGTLDLASGDLQPVDPEAPVPSAWSIDLADGWRVSMTSETGGAIDRTLIEGPDGVLDLDAARVELGWVDDGSADPLLVHAAAGLDAVDPRDGRVLWSRDGAGGGVLARVEGVAVVSTDLSHGTIWALDLRSGAELWTSIPPDRNSSYALASDGRRLLLRQHAEEVPPLSAGALAAVDLRTGRTLWTQTLDPGVKLVEVADGHVVVHGDHGVTVLR